MTPVRACRHGSSSWVGTAHPGGQCANGGCRAGASSAQGHGVGVGGGPLIGRDQTPPCFVDRLRRPDQAPLRMLRAKVARIYEAGMGLEHRTRAFGAPPRHKVGAAPAPLRLRPSRQRAYSLVDGSRLVQRLRSRRARRRHRRVYRRLPGSPAGAQGRARRRGQDRRDVPASWLYPDQGAARIGGVRGQGAPRQGLRPDASRGAGHRLRGLRRPQGRGRQTDVDRAQVARDQEQGHLGRRPRPPRRAEQGAYQPAGRGRDARQGR